MTETLPYSWYTDPDVLAQERARLFSSAWQYAGHSGELAEPGSYLTLQVGEVPLVVVRDRERTLRAFVNVCRHRGAEVVRGRGSCTTLQCHYHAWTYGLDGKLRAAPRSEADPEFDHGKLGLKPAQVDSWGPLIFVNADAAAPGNQCTLRAAIQEAIAGAETAVGQLEEQSFGIVVGDRVGGARLDLGILVAEEIRRVEAEVVDRARRAVDTQWRSHGAPPSGPSFF